ncbi:MAG: hypothetical protein QOH25_1017 [Acidobacteriota bacterium]|nr:hypothetical protein [Acidobacteriota bacterium]
MKNKLDKRTRLAFAAVLVALAMCGVVYARASFLFGASTDLDYFKGEWVVTMRSNPNLSFRWTVKEDLSGGWLSGVVERNGQKVSTDFWRRSGNRIERFAFTTDGAFVRLDGAGWEGNQLALKGVTSGREGETKIRETITRVNDRQFQALWEKENTDGKWIVFADEICVRR